MKRVLLASLSAGGGHHALRDSFVSVLEHSPEARGSIQAVPWDSSDRFVNWFYTAIVHHLPRFQGHAHELSDMPWVLDLATHLSPQLFRETQAVLRETPLDAVVSTHVLLSMMFTKAKHSLGLSIPIIAAIPDYGTPTQAFRPPQKHLRSDHAIAMAEDTYRHLVRYEGEPGSLVHLSGFVTREPFRRVGKLVRAHGDKRQVRAELLPQLAQRQPELAGLLAERPLTLFLGGSAWTAKSQPVLELMLADPALNQDVNIVVVCGKDAKFEQTLKARTAQHSNVRVLGFVTPDVLARLMGCSDVPVLGSLAPATMQELLETQCGPLMLFHFIPGTERPHVAYIEQHRIGAYESDAVKMLSLVEQVLGRRRMTAEMAALHTGFAERASDIRRASFERAFQLPAFLRRVVENEGRRHGYAPEPQASAVA